MILAVRFGSKLTIDSKVCLSMALCTIEHLILAILFRPFGFIADKTFNYLDLSNLSILRYLIKVIPETYLMKVIPETYLMKVIPETYLMKVILSVLDEGYSERT
jgi:hypothetical protein